MQLSALGHDPHILSGFSQGYVSGVALALFVHTLTPNGWALTYIVFPNLLLRLNSPWIDTTEQRTARSIKTTNTPIKPSYSITPTVSRLLKPLKSQCCTQGPYIRRRSEGLGPSCGVDAEQVFDVQRPALDAEALVRSSHDDQLNYVGEPFFFEYVFWRST
jgi:hypothetical protein